MNEQFSLIKNINLYFLFSKDDFEEPGRVLPVFCMLYNYTADLTRIEIRVIHDPLKGQDQLQIFGYVYYLK